LKLKISAVLLTFATLVGCGGNSVDLFLTPPEVETGVFIDSAVSGLNYSTETQSGITNVDGEFNYVEDETIIFSIGDIIFPELTAIPTISPLEVFATNDINDEAVVNMLRLLQSLDVDGDAENGIEISETTHQLATGFAVSFTDSNFETVVQSLVQNSGGALTSLVSAEQATAHFTQTLAGDTGSGCTSNHSRVGHTGEFITFSHDVSGIATIIDDCTIEITQFTYDGGGPQVYFYGGIDKVFNDESAFEIGDLLTNNVFDNDTLTITLPEGRTLDDLNSLSVWCVRFNANFGSLYFTEPES